MGYSFLSTNSFSLLLYSVYPSLPFFYLFPSLIPFSYSFLLLSTPFSLPFHTTFYSTLFRIVSLLLFSTFTIPFTPFHVFSTLSNSSLIPPPLFFSFYSLLRFSYLTLYWKAFSFLTKLLNLFPTSLSHVFSLLY